MTTPARAPWIPGGGTALDWGLRDSCPVGVGPGGYRGEGGKVWCLHCGDRFTGRPAQVGDDHLHRDDAHHAARLHADDHEADFRRFVTAERTREAREKSGWTSRVYGLVAAATGEDPDGGVWWDGSGYRLVPAGARLGAKGRRVRRRVVELVIKAGFLQQDERGDVVATPDGRAMLKIWQHHRADLAEPWPARHEPQALPPLPGGQEARQRREAARQRMLELERQAAQSRAEFLRRREEAEQRHQAELEAARQCKADEQAERQRAERDCTGADIDLTWSAVGAGRWTVTGSGHDRRLDVTLNTTDFAAEMYEIRENGHFVSRHRYRHHADAAVRQLLADGVEIGERTPGPTPAASTEPDPAAPAGRWHQAPPPPTLCDRVHSSRRRADRLASPGAAGPRHRSDFMAEVAVRQKTKRLTGSLLAGDPGFGANDHARSRKRSDRRGSHDDTVLWYRPGDRPGEQPNRLGGRGERGLAGSDLCGRRSVDRRRPRRRPRSGPREHDPSARGSVSDSGPHGADSQEGV
ncbi:hypothetical protein [Kitasatospora purpeofusca]|uniref:hypothetical protein n=1 Tax=Kitasatospora purpeofusca TaxID=67352 RepID=UPI00386D3FEB